MTDLLGVQLKESATRRRGARLPNHIDEVVGDDAKADPALHSGKAFVATSIQSVSSLDDTNAAFAPGAPFLAVSEPALFLLALAR